MGTFVYYFDVNIFLLIFFAGAVYLMALLALKTFSEEDFDIIKKLILPTIGKISIYIGKNKK